MAAVIKITFKITGTCPSKRIFSIGPLWGPGSLPPPFRIPPGAPRLRLRGLARRVPSGGVSSVAVASSLCCLVFQALTLAMISISQALFFSQESSLSFLFLILLFSSFNLWFLTFPFPPLTFFDSKLPLFVSGLCSVAFCVYFFTLWLASFLDTVGELVTLMR